MEKSTFSELLKELRSKSGLSITELADKSGVSRPYLSQLENGKKGTPSIKVINDLSSAFNMSSMELARLAGHFSPEEIKLQNEFARSLALKEDEEQARKNYEDLRIEEMEFEEFRKENYPNVKEILEHPNLSYNEYKISNEDKIIVGKILEALFGHKEKNYPSKEEIKYEYDQIVELSNLASAITEESANNFDGPSEAESAELAEMNLDDTLARTSYKNEDEKE